MKSVHFRSFSGPYSVRIRENTDQKNSEYGHFSRSVSITNSLSHFPSIIIFHNKKILDDIKTRLLNVRCDCKDKSFFPPSANCLQSSIIDCCKAVTSNIGDNIPRYIGLTENKFKYKKEDKNSTDLSNFVWDRKHENVMRTLLWSILN